MTDEAWVFADAKHTMVITTRDIIERHTPILYVSHDEEDGMWQFHTGAAPDLEAAVIVGLAEVVLQDATLKQLADLPMGWIAWRSTSTGEWQRGPKNELMQAIGHT